MDDKLQMPEAVEGAEISRVSVGSGGMSEVVSPALVPGAVNVSARCATSLMAMLGQQQIAGIKRQHASSP
eukprot:gene31143-39085_t